MKETQFVSQYTEEWTVFNHWLQQPNHPLTRLDDFPASYRRICHQLALARARGFSATTVNQLEHMVLLGHQQLYKPNAQHYAKRAIITLLHRFPIAFRQHWRFMLASGLMFILPALIAFVWIHFHPNSIYSVLPVDSIYGIEESYEPHRYAASAEERDASDDIKMFGFYIYNNISIALRTFALGIFGMIGSVFALFYNGLTLGAVAAHLQNEGYASKTLLPFVIGHGAFELTAIVLAGGCGLRLGYAVIAPQRLTRGPALRIAALDVLPIVYGMSVMLLIAAGLEAFWSPRAIISSHLKMVVGCCLWLLVWAFLLFVGRTRGSR